MQACVRSYGVKDLILAGSFVWMCILCRLLRALAAFPANSNSEHLFFIEYVCECQGALKQWHAICTRFSLFSYLSILYGLSPPPVHVWAHNNLRAHWHWHTGTLDTRISGKNEYWPISLLFCNHTWPQNLVLDRLLLLWKPCVCVCVHQCMWVCEVQINRQTDRDDGRETDPRGNS